MQIPFHVMVIKVLSAQRNSISPYLAKEGLSSGQPKILAYLTQHDRCKQRELADYYHIEAATVSRLLSNMEEKGLVRRESRQGEKRASTVVITDEGRQVFARMQVHFEEVERQELAGFSQEEEKQLREFLQRIHQNLTGKELE